MVQVSIDYVFVDWPQSNRMYCANLGLLALVCLWDMGKRRMTVFTVFFVFSCHCYPITLFQTAKVTFEIFSRWIRKMYILKWSEAVWSSNTLNKNIIISFSTWLHLSKCLQKHIWWKWYSFYLNVVPSCTFHFLLCETMDSFRKCLWSNCVSESKPLLKSVRVSLN